MCLKLLNTYQQVLQVSQEAQQNSPKLHVLTLRWPLWPSSFRERHLFKEDLSSVSCSCSACVSSRGSVRYVRYTRDKGSPYHHQRHMNNVISETQLCFSCKRGFLEQQTGQSAILGQMCHYHHMCWVTLSSLCEWLPQKVAIFIAADSFAGGKDDIWHSLKGYEVGLCGHSACPGTSYQFGKESRANGLSAYKPGINHACKSSHLKNLTNQSPSCNTEFLLSGKYCTNLLASLMIKVDTDGKYAGGYLCSVNPSDQKGGWGVLYQSCSCSGRQCPEMIASLRIRLQL